MRGVVTGGVETGCVVTGSVAGVGGRGLDGGACFGTDGVMDLGGVGAGVDGRLFAYHSAVRPGKFLTRS
jgi:hypothetical protein